MKENEAGGLTDPERADEDGSIIDIGDDPKGDLKKRRQGFQRTTEEKEEKKEEEEEALPEHQSTK